MFEKTDGQVQLVIAVLFVEDNSPLVEWKSGPKRFMKEEDGIAEDSNPEVPFQTMSPKKEQ